MKRYISFAIMLSFFTTHLMPADYATNNLLGFFIDLQPFMEEMGIKAHAKLGGAEAKINVVISDGWIRCYKDDDTKIAEVSVTSKAYPEFFSAVSDFNSWSSYLYYKFFFTWDYKADRSYMGRKGAWRTIITGYKSITKDKPLREDKAKKIYDLYRMAIAIIAAETNIAVAVLDNQYKVTIFEWDVVPQGDAASPDTKLHFTYNKHTTLDEFRRQHVYQKLHSCYEFDSQGITGGRPKKETGVYKVGECSVVITDNNGRELKDDEIMPNLKGRSDYQLEVNKSMLAYKRLKKKNSIEMIYSNPSSMWLNGKRIAKAQVILTLMPQEKDALRFKIALEAWDKHNKRLESSGSVIIDKTDFTDEQIKWFAEAFMRRLTKTIGKSVTDRNVYWEEGDFRISKDALCTSAIELYARKKGFAFSFGGRTIVSQRSSRSLFNREWISNKLALLGLGAGALAYWSYSARK